MATMMETARNSQSGVNGARAIIKPESTLIWHLLHSLYLCNSYIRMRIQMSQTVKERATTPGPKHLPLPGISPPSPIRASFLSALQSAEIGFQLLHFPTSCPTPFLGH